jgi:hypothetical protein
VNPTPEELAHRDALSEEHEIRCRVAREALVIRSGQETIEMFEHRFSNSDLLQRIHRGSACQTSIADDEVFVP